MAGLALGQPKEPKPVKLVVSLILASDGLFVPVLEDLRLRYGENDFISHRIAFDFTDYYGLEMGADLNRRIVAFRRLIAPDALSSVKHETNQIEQKYAREARRRVNIDPGYVCGEHMILATTKAYAHRPYLKDGIYADLTLIYRKGTYRSLDWTYPDYRQQDVVDLFNGIRKTYLLQLGERDRPMAEG